MAQMTLIALFASLAVLSSGERMSLQSKMQLSANPIRRIVTMLQDMQKKVEEEGVKQQELHDKFLCYCKNGQAELAKTIEDGETKVPQLESDIKGSESEKQQLDEDLASHKADREEAKAAMAKATGIREKEGAAFAAEHADEKTNLESLGKALTAIEKGNSGGFLQTSAAAVLRRLTLSQDLGNADRDTLTAFLTQGNGEEAPASGEIVGIMKQMQDTMNKDLADLIAQEESAKKEYDELMAAKQHEVDSLTKAIEEKTKRVGEVGIALVDLKEDADDTAKSLAEDKKMLADMVTNCEKAVKEHEAVCKTRQEELLALADTIKMLNDDDALELFKKVVPSASFLQVQVSSKEVQAEALRVLQGFRKSSGHRGDVNLSFITLMLHGKKVDMTKVVKMIDDMIVLLGKEQVDDDTKKAYCAEEFDKADDKKKALTRVISDLEKVINEDKEMVETIAGEIKDLEDGILKLDREVAGATMQRKAEHEEFAATNAANNAAIQLIEMAKTRMNKFYNPKLIQLYKAPAEAPAEEGTSALQFTEAHKKAESGGVIAMMDEMKAEVTAENQELEFNENDAQEEYVLMVNDAAEKRTSDKKSVEEKTAVKAGLEDEIVKNGDQKASEDAELMATKQYIADLHADCDWLISNFDTRKEARANEIDALKKAKGVLSGASFVDFSLVQTGRRAMLRHHM